MDDENVGPLDTKNGDNTNSVDGILDDSDPEDFWDSLDVDEDD
jgi:hypothetical protein